MLSMLEHREKANLKTHFITKKLQWERKTKQVLHMAAFIEKKVQIVLEENEISTIKTNHTDEQVSKH
ncbi:hypothetical protein E2320_017625 [Naja naja]|nr:hypothetical protein E2320_017625 [Naja naja]